MYFFAETNVLLSLIFVGASFHIFAASLEKVRVCRWDLPLTCSSGLLESYNQSNQDEHNHWMIVGGLVFCPGLKSKILLVCKHNTS